MAAKKPIKQAVTKAAAKPVGKTTAAKSSAAQKPLATKRTTTAASKRTTTTAATKRSDKENEDPLQARLSTSPPTPRARGSRD